MDDISPPSRHDLEDFAARYEETVGALYAWACLRVPSALRARIDPEDVIQEVFCRAFEGRATFDSTRGEFRAWVFGIAANVVMKAMRRVREVPAAAAGGPSTFDFELIPASVTTVSRRVARDEDMRAFVARLDELEGVERRLVAHRGLEGRPMADVAKILGIEVTAARKRWQRLREKLAGLSPPVDLMGP